MGCLQLKVVTNFSIDKKVLKQFNEAKGCYSKSALVESWIIDFLKNKNLSYPLGQTRTEKTSSFKKRGFTNV